MYKIQSRRAVSRILSESCATSGAGQLPLHHLPSSNTQSRKHGDGEDDDPHSPEPLGELAPHVDRPRKTVVVGDDGGAGCREARHPFEVGVDWMSKLIPARNEVGERCKTSSQKPCRGDDEKSLAHTHSCGSTRGSPLHRESQPARDEPRREEGPDRLPVPKCNRHRKEGSKPQVLAEHPDEVRDRPDIDREADESNRSAI
jgi:hypothetical protein